MEDFDNLMKVVNVCVYNNNDENRILTILVEKDGYTPERAHIIMNAALTYLKLKGK
jgi:hypothetical protein